jgi:hypothetical protein
MLAISTEKGRQIISFGQDAPAGVAETSHNDAQTQRRTEIQQPG